MTEKEQWIADQSTYETVRPAGLLARLKRLPDSLRWKLVIGLRNLKRDSIGLWHTLQGRKIVHLFHIGKTGGSAVGAALEGHSRSGDYEIIHHDHDFTLDHVPSTEYFAVVVRDPIARFVSGFYSRQRQDRPRYPHAVWRPEEAVAFDRFHSPNQLALALSSDDAELRQAAARAIKDIYFLHTPQILYFKSKEYLLSRRSKVLFIGFQETLDDDFALFTRILNLPAGLELPRDEVIAHRNPAHVDRRLDPEAVNNLKIWYRKDYEILETCKEIAAEIRARYESAPALTTGLAPAAHGQGTSKPSGTAML